MPYGNALRYQLGDPGFGSWLHKRFKGGFRRLKGVGRLASLIPGPVGTLASLVGDPGRAKAKGITKHAVKHQARQATKAHPGGKRRAGMRGAQVGAFVKGAAQQLASVPALQQFLPLGVSEALAIPGSQSEVAESMGVPSGHPAAKAMHRALGGRHRRMRVTNAKALRRAAARVRGFVRTYKRVARDLGLHVVRSSGRPAHAGRKR